MEFRLHLEGSSLPCGLGGLGAPGMLTFTAAQVALAQAVVYELRITALLLNKRVY